MDHKRKSVGGLCTVAFAVALAGCSAPIPRDPVPEDWALEVHQPGEWWTQPLIPRSVVVQRCPPPLGWASDPDLRSATGLPPGSSIEYSSLFDDYHCTIGWAEPASEVEFSIGEMSTETGLRRICTSSGLPMDASWRFLGSHATERVGDLPDAGDAGVEPWEVTTAAFIDDFGTVAGCLVEHMGEAGAWAWVELSAGADAAGDVGDAACPVQPRNMGRGEDGTLAEYQLRGAGAVRDDRGKVLTDATTLQIGVVGDDVMTSHPVVDGIAIVDAWVMPNVTIPFDWDQPLPLKGHIRDADGDLLATCRG